MTMKANVKTGSHEILLVDDNEADAKIFEASLLEASARARVYWVASGEEAMEYLRRDGRFADVGPAKLVVLDINMPGMDGMETLRRIKSDPSTSRIPVVLLSSARSPDEVDLAYSLGANAYFCKPISLESYVQKVKVIVQHWLDSAELPSVVTPSLRRAAVRGRVPEHFE